MSIACFICGFGHGGRITFCISSATIGWGNPHGSFLAYRCPPSQGPPTKLLVKLGGDKWGRPPRDRVVRDKFLERKATARVKNPYETCLTSAVTNGKRAFRPKKKRVCTVPCSKSAYQVVGCA